MIPEEVEKLKRDAKDEILQELFTKMGKLQTPILDRRYASLLKRSSRYDKGYDASLHDVAHLINSLRSDYKKEECDHD